MKGLNRYKGWTNEELELLKILLVKNEKMVNIAKQLQRPRGSINRKIRDVKAGGAKIKRYWTVEELLMLKELLQKGLSAKQISEILGRTKSAINNKLAKMGTDIWNEKFFKRNVC